MTGNSLLLCVLATLGALGMVACWVLANMQMASMVRAANVLVLGALGCVLASPAESFVASDSLLSECFFGFSGALVFALLRNGWPHACHLTGPKSRRLGNPNPIGDWCLVLSLSSYAAALMFARDGYLRPYPEAFVSVLVGVLISWSCGNSFQRKGVPAGLAGHLASGVMVLGFVLNDEIRVKVAVSQLASNPGFVVACLVWAGVMHCTCRLMARTEWSYRPSRQPLVSGANQGINFTATERGKRLVAHGGWVPLSGLVVMSVVMLIFASREDSGAGVSFEDIGELMNTVVFIQSFCFAVVCCCTIAIVAIKSCSGLVCASLLCALMVSILSLLEVYEPSGFLLEENAKETLLPFLCFPILAVFLIRTLEFLFARTGGDFGPPRSRRKISTRLLMTVTLLVGVQIALTKAAATEFLVPVLVVLLVFTPLTYFSLRRHLFKKTWKNFCLAVFYLMTLIGLMLVLDAVLGFGIDIEEFGSSFLVGIIIWKIAMHFCILWLDQCGWRRQSDIETESETTQEAMILA